MEDVYELADMQKAGEGIEVSLELQPGECVVLLGQKNIVCNVKHKPIMKQMEGMGCEDISKSWTVSMVKAKDYPEFPEGTHVDELKAVSDENPSFVGVIRYEKSIHLDKVPKEAVLKAEQVFEMMKVVVNGSEAGVRIFPLYQVEIGSELKEGENQIVIEVTTTPAREMLEIPQPHFDFSHEALEPTGMFGKVELYLG